MEYILLAFAIFCIFYSTISITLCRALKRSKQADRPQIERCRVCNVLLFEHNHGCNIEHTCNYDCECCDTRDGCHTWLNRDIDKAAAIAEIENHLLSDYSKYRELVMELPSLTMGKCADCEYGYQNCNIRDMCNDTPSVSHINGDTYDNQLDNLEVEKTISVEFITSGLKAQRETVYDQSLTWTEQIDLWERHEFIEYPEGYEQGIVILKDGKEIAKFESAYYNGSKIKKLMPVEKVKKVRKSKVKV